MASESFNLLTDVANPSPIAVPSSIIPLFTSSKIFDIIVWSVVRGTWVKASPLNITRLTLSFGRRAMNSSATSLAASSLSGLKSRASILPETSMVITMSMPSMCIFCFVDIACGRAKATAISAIASILRTNNP